MRDFKRRRGNIRLPSKNAKAKNIVVKARHPNDSTTPRGKSSGEERGSIHKVWCLGSENKTLLLCGKRATCMDMRRSRSKLGFLIDIGATT